MAVKDTFFSEIAKTAAGDIEQDTFQSEQAASRAELTDPVQVFKQGVVSGGYNLAANLEYFKGIGNSIQGDQDALEKNLYAAEKLERESGMAMADVQQFDEFLENPTFLGFINQVSSATGQFAPSAIASIGAAVSGAGAGVAVVGLTGVTKGLVNNVAKKEVKRALTKKMKGQTLNPDEEDLVKGADQTPVDQEQFMLLEFVSGQVESMSEDLENMAHNKVNIMRLQKDMEKALTDIESLKDKIRNNGH